MRATLRDAKESRIAKTIGLCADSDDFVAYINEAQQRLITRGHWKGSFQLIRLCVEDQCITLPRQVASLSGVTLCDTPYNIQNQWWEFVTDGQGFWHADDDNACGCPGRNFIDRGWHPTFADIKPQDKFLRLYHTVASDIGKKVLIQGYDENRQWIRSQDGGNWIDGFYLTLADPFVESTFTVSSVTGVQKPATDGNVLLYEVTSDNLQRELGIYEPSERTANYRRYQVQHLPCTGCCDSTTIMALAKLEFIPVSSDTDYLYIDCIPALKEMCQAIRFAEMDNPAGQRQALLYESRAVRELNHDKIHHAGDDTIAVAMHTQGSAHLSKRRIGRLM